MIDHDRQKNKKGTLPSFTPVPRHYNRHDGWTPERQRGFIEALAETGSVKAAAHAVNMTPEGAYLLRRHPEAAEFRNAWEAALACGIQRLEDVAMDRALNGVEVPVYSYGKLVGTRRKYNDRLLMFLLRNRSRKRFADGGQPNAVDRSAINRLKKDWRKQWERERALQSLEESQAVQASLTEKIDHWMERKTRQIARAMRADWLRLGGPPALPDDEDEDEEWQQDADYAEIEDDAEEAPPEPAEPDAAAASEPAEPIAPEQPASHRTVSIRHPWPDDGRATPFYGRW